MGGFSIAGNNHTISNNFASNNRRGDGFTISSINNTLLKNNIAIGNSGNNGFSIFSQSFNNILANNTAKNNRDGFDLNYFNNLNNTISQNIAMSNTGNGFNMISAKNYILQGNLVSENGAYGFLLSFSNNNTFINNTQSNGVIGFYFPLS